MIITAKDFQNYLHMKLMHAQKMNSIAQDKEEKIRMEEQEKILKATKYYFNENT